MLSRLVSARPRVCRACSLAYPWPRSRKAHCRRDACILYNSSGGVEVLGISLPRWPRANYSILDWYPLATSDWVGVRVWVGETSFSTGPFPWDLVRSLLFPAPLLVGFINWHCRLMRYFGCFTAYGLFIWRYLNIPRNWGYVGSFWSIAIIVTTLIPETVYPFLYIWVFNQNKSKVKMG